MNKLKRRNMVNYDANNIIKDEYHQVCIHVIECKHLMWPTMDSYVCVEVDNHKKNTRKKENTNCPYFDEVYSPTSICLTKKALGSITMDVGTLYAQQDHQFFQTWALLLSPEDTFSDGKGFIKCTIAVLGKGEVIKSLAQEEDIKEDNKANILNDSQIARYVCRIYKAQGNFASHDTCKIMEMSEVQKNSNKNKDVNSKINVELKFGNLTGSTSFKNNISGQVEWNEQITFMGRFPPLFHKLVLQIKDGNSSKSSKSIAEHVFKMEDISCDKKEGFPPSFGPAYVHMYSKQASKGCRIYRAKLLFSLETVFNGSSRNIETAKKNLIEIGPVIQADEFQEDSLSNMLIFCNIFHLVCLNRKVDPTHVQMEVNFGLQTASTAEDISKKKNKTDKHMKELQDLCRRINGPNKPCLWMNYPCPKNIVYRVHQYNIMSRISHYLEEKLLFISDHLEKKEDVEARILMDDLLDELREKCRKGFALMGAKPTRDGTRTTLDWERLHMLRRELEFITCVTLELKKTLNETNLNYATKVLEDFVEKIHQLMEEPQRPYPDIIISLAVNGKRLAQIKFKIEELLFSQDLESMGEDCGSKIILFFKEMQHKGDSETRSDHPIAMAVELFFWAGFFMDDSGTYLEGLPRGYTVDKGGARISLNETITPTKVLRYYEKRNYQFRAHLFQGRFVPGADATGLCDAYIQLYICNNTLKTQVQHQTLNPVWDQMLLLRNIILCGTPQDIKNNPPTVVIEAMDKDSFGQVEFMGRGVAKPTVKLVNERLQKKEDKSRLEWIELFNAGEYSGEVLSAFELVELTDEKEDLSFPKDRTRKGEIHRIPPYIRPILAHYNLKVLFWGLRCYGKTNFKLGSSPLITVEVGGITVKSSSKDKGDGFFTSSFATTELELPEDLQYCPPVTIKVWEKRSFGRLLLVGSHIVYSIAHISKGEDTGSAGPTPIVKEIVPKQETGSSDDDSPEDDIMKPLLKRKMSRVRNMRMGRFLSHNQANKRENTPFDDIQHYDWWTKYYESLSVLKVHERCGGKKTCFEQCDAFSLETGDWKWPISENDQQFDDQENGSDEIKGSNQKGLLKPFFRKILHALKLIRRDNVELLKSASTKIKRSYGKENDTNTRNEKMPTKASFVIYPNELEKQAEFHGFEDWVDSFIILHGKKRRFESPEKRIVGKFKGCLELKKSDVTLLESNNRQREDISGVAFKIFNVSKTTPTSPCVLANPLQIPTFKILVRVYIVRAFSLPPKDLSGRSDPYVVVSVGRRIAKGTDSRNHSKFRGRVSGDRMQYVQQDLNPIFGRCYEVEATLPRDNMITVSIWDWDLGGHDDLIGTTEIDIENRFFTKHRASCGISSNFEKYGYNAWRDPENPTIILNNLCEHHEIPTPTYKENQIILGDSCFYNDNVYPTETRTQQKETLALAVLKEWAKISAQEGKSGLALVPEHIETRSLFNPKKEGIVQGKLEMWVDIFRLPKWIEDKDSAVRFLRPPVDISPRKPKRYELRVIIWNTASIELRDTNIFNEKSSDIYVKGWLYGPDVDGQTTDVHYRSLTGEGNFNWRFVFPLSYLEPEKCIVTSQQDNATGEAVKFVKSLITATDSQGGGRKIPCRLQFQVWDEDRFTADDFIGAISLDLTNCPIGAKTAKACNATLLEDKNQKVDLFKIRRLRGWWPIVKSESTEGKNEKKDANFILTGKIDAEIQMLMENDAQKKPAGRGREGPDALPEPKRPDTSFSWLQNPLHVFKYGIWQNNKKTIIIWIIIILLVIFFLLMLYSLPGYLIKKILGV